MNTTTVLARGALTRIKTSLILCALLGATAPPALASPPWLTTDRLLVRLRPGASEKQGKDEIKRRGGQVVDRIDPLGMLVVKVPPASARAAREALSQSPRFDLVEPEALHPPTFIPNDPLASSEWHLAKLELFAAWDFGLGNHGVPIAILDSGVNAGHADLAANIVPGWNFYSNDSNTSDVYGHGTEVAGTAAAVGNNGIGVAGVAPGCAIMPIRVAGTNGYASDTAIAKGLVWAADRGVRVANLSFAGIHNAPGLQSSAQYFVSHGGLVTASAGNYGVDDGSADNPYVISVSATGSDDVKATWSSFGQYVDAAAPGSGIYSTLAGGDYALVAGTSFSAPVAAGVIALIFSANPSLSSQQAEAILESNADDLGAPGFDTYYGSGRVNARRAVFAALGQAEPPPDTTPPSATLTAPAAGQVLSGDVVISASASDNRGVSEVRFYVDGQTIAVDTTPPYEADWNTVASGNGTHTLTVDAFDSAGNWGTSAPVQVSISNGQGPPLDESPPTVTLDSPSNGSTLSGSVSITATASDNVGILEVWFYLDGVLLGKDSSPPYGITWDSTGTGNGSHFLTADAFDLSYNWGTTQPVQVTLSNAEAPPSLDLTKPSAVLTSPAPGATVGGYVGIAATAWDNVGVYEVWFYVDGQLLSRDSIPPYTASWDTSVWPDGTHTLTADAFDETGNWGTTSPVQVVVDNQSGSALDLDSPSVDLVSPLNGSTVTGQISLVANASDNVGVVRVAYYLDGAPLAVDHSPPFVITWNSAGASDGIHTLTADAFDETGNWGTTSPVQILIANQAGSTLDLVSPSVSLVSPLNGSVVAGQVIVTANALDNVGVVRVAFYLDGAPLVIDAAPPFVIAWNTAGASDGVHTLTADAFDATGNWGTSGSVVVNVSNGPPDVLPPTVKITTPPKNANVTGTVLVQALASDKIGVTQVRFRVDGRLIGTDATAPYSVFWNTAADGFGNHDLTAEAFDAAGNHTTSQSIAVHVH